jgi:hypothetical protein
VERMDPGVKKEFSMSMNLEMRFTKSCNPFFPCCSDRKVKEARRGDDA